MDMEEGGLDSRLEEAGDRDSSMENDPVEVEEARAEYEHREKVYNSRDTRESRQAKSKKEEKGKPNSGKLESIIQKSKKEARASGMDESEYFSTHPEKIISYLEEADDSERDTWEGAVAFIYNAKKGEFLIEEEYGKQSGKLRLIGGQKEYYDASTFETVAREIGEEVKKPAKHILLKYLRNNGTRYGSIINFINGGEVKSDIIEIHISTPKDWETVSRAQPTGGAGPFHVKTYDELWSIPDTAFAYGHGPIIKKFILEDLVQDKDFLKHSNYTHAYSIPIITTNRNHLNAVNSFNNYSHSLN